MIHLVDHGWNMRTVIWSRGAVPMFPVQDTGWVCAGGLSSLLLYPVIPLCMVLHFPWRMVEYPKHQTRVTQEYYPWASIKRHCNRKSIYHIFLY